MTTQEHLDAINSAISARLGGGTVENWKDGTHLFSHTPLDKLYAIKNDLERQLSQESRGVFLPLIDAQGG